MLSMLLQRAILEPLTTCTWAAPYQRTTGRPGGKICKICKARCFYVIFGEFVVLKRDSVLRCRLVVFSMMSNLHHV
jgi:hypothetical protein